MKRNFPTLSNVLTVLTLTALTLSSCVGQLERQFPWEQQVDHGITTLTLPPTAKTARNMVVLDFTATWCVNCPKMASAIDDFSGNGGGIIPIAVHYSDALACDASNYLVERFGVTSFPVAVFGFDTGLRTSTASAEILKALAGQSFSAAPKGCNLALKADIGEDGTFSIEADVEYLSDGSYSIGAALLEDGIVMPQTGSGDGYVHDNVLRAFLQENYDGDSLGTKTTGDADKLSFSFTPKTEWNADALKVVVYVIFNGDSPVVCNASVLSLS